MTTEKLYSWCERVEYLANNKERWIKTIFDHFDLCIRLHTSFCDTCKSEVDNWTRSGYSLVMQRTGTENCVGLFNEEVSF